MFKITTKTTKKELKDILGANAKAVKEQDTELFDRIAYADKVAKKDDSKVTRKDLVDLVKDTMKLLGDTLVVPALAEETPAEPAKKEAPKVENSVKKSGKGLSKKQKSLEKEEVAEQEEATADTEETEQEEVVEEKVDDKKSAKKSLGSKKKEKAKKDGVTVLEGTEKTVQLAKMFPQTLEVKIGDDDCKYELASDIKTMEDLYNALEQDEEIVIAYYWTKRHLRQFPYFNGWLGQPKSFENDLDLATVMYVSEELRVSYQVSANTEAVYTLLPEDFAEEDGIRISGGTEFQIYRRTE